MHYLVFKMFNKYYSELLFLNTVHTLKTFGPYRVWTDFIMDVCHSSSKPISQPL